MLGYWFYNGPSPLQKRLKGGTEGFSGHIVMAGIHGRRKRNCKYTQVIDDGPNPTYYLIRQFAYMQSNMNIEIKQQAVI
jgi:hypothetical protein